MIVKSVQEKRVRLFSLAVALTSVAVVFACGAIPIPLLIRYREFFHLTSGDVAAATAAYFAGCVIALVFLSRLSDVYGRRPITVGAILLSVVALFCLNHSHGIFVFALSRLLQGTAAGLVSSATLAWLADLLMPKHPLAASAAATGTPSLGFCLGAAAVGTMTDSAQSVTLLIESFGIALVILVPLTSGCLETARHARIPVKSMLTPRIGLPKQLRQYLLPILSAYGISWSFSALLQGFSSAYCETLFSGDNTLAASLLFIAFIVPNTLGVLIPGKPGADHLRRAIVFFTVSLGGFVISNLLGQILFFYFFTLVTGTACGVVCAASMRLLLSMSQAKERARIVSFCFFAGYTGAVCAGFTTGFFARTFSVETVTVGYYCAIAAVSFIGLQALRRNRAATDFLTQCDPMTTAMMEKK